MIHLVGIGNTGCNLANLLAQYPQYKAHEIDVDKGVKQQKTPEDYEKNCPSFKKKFSGINGEVWVMLSASGNISGITLRVLEQLRGNKLNVLCVTSDTGLLSIMANLQQKLVVGVLQQYARSGALNSLYLVDNQKVEELLGDVPLDEYWDKLNEVITYTFHTLMCLKHMKPLMETKEEESEISNVRSFGILDPSKNKKMFYDLKNVTRERYYYSFTKEQIKKDGKILKNIKERVISDEQVSKTFAVFESKNQDPVVYIDCSTHILD